MPDPNVLTKITVQDKQESVYSGGDDDPDRGRYRLFFIIKKVLRSKCVVRE